MWTLEPVFLDKEKKSNYYEENIPIAVHDHDFYSQHSPANSHTKRAFWF